MRGFRFGMGAGCVPQALKIFALWLRAFRACMQQAKECNDHGDHGLPNMLGTPKVATAGNGCQWVKMAGKWWWVVGSR